MKNILVIGIGRFGLHTVKRLSEIGHDVLIIDSNEERLEKGLAYAVNGQIGNSTNEAFIRSIGVSQFDMCFVCIGDDFQASLETTCLLKEAGAPVVISRASDDAQAKFLLRNGADHVVYPQKEMAEWAAIRYTADGLIDYIEVDDDHGIYELNIPGDWVGKTLAQLDIRRKYNINIIGYRKKPDIEYMVSPDVELTADISLIVFGATNDVYRCFRL